MRSCLSSCLFSQMPVMEISLISRLLMHTSNVTGFTSLCRLFAATEDICYFIYICNRVYCVFRAMTFESFLSCPFPFDWVGVLWPQLSKVLKLVRWARRAIAQRKTRCTSV